METWNKFFIVDTSVSKARNTYFGRGFICFLENGDPHFGYNPNNVKLYDTKDEAIKDYDKIPDKVALYRMQISLVNQQINAVHEKVAFK